MARTPLSPSASPKRAGAAAGWFKLWSAVSFASVPFALIFAASPGFNLGGVMVAPASEVIAAVFLSVLIFGPTFFWSGWMALRIMRQLLNH